ncbi:hypothetical protein INS49_011416 [Diaporthe citri]|uniref:uncharacterized protein n=1 Tax=Diaporthe citri TaxID=83186 RepID=UPI001C817D4C|nr:uncharacterized protein INS49_011416 [Diaporthe citri]KAG6360358.1 hypothetical protein INS49_011416 [Diaporthe citri]
MKLAFAPLLLSGALALPEPGTATSHKVSMSNGHSLTRPDGRANVPGIFASLNATLMKFGTKPLPHYEPVAQQQAEYAAERHRQKATNKMVLAMDDKYYGPVTIGSKDGNAQTFELIFDTGSSDIWVPSPGCGPLDGCVHSNKYDGGGIDLQTTVPSGYLTASVSGDIYVDDMTIAGLKSANQTLMAIKSATGFSNLDADGICGMAFSFLAKGNAITFFENLVASGAVEKDEFSFYLGRLASGTGSDSEMVLGGRDSTKYTGPFVTLPVVSETYWQVDLDNVKVRGLVAGLHTKGQAAIDTGTPMIIAPPAAAREIMSQIPGSLPLSMQIHGSAFDMFLFPCDTADSYIPSITFAGANFQISPVDFNIGKVAPEEVDEIAMGSESLAAEIRTKMGEVTDYCVAGLKGVQINSASGTTDLYVIGAAFLKNWYTVMSYSANNGSPAVLFAPSIGNVLSRDG